MKTPVLVTLLLALTLPGYPQQCTVDWNDVHQRIDGFGASSAWRSTWTTAQADMFFSTNYGIGLSLLRNHIKTDGISSDETGIMFMAQERGARVWSAPWSPPPQFKDNNNVNGGNFVGTLANYQAWAKLLATYITNMNQLGINIYALSVQNEPDVAASYESCKWTGQQIHDFVTNLYSTLVASNLSSVKIMIPESQHWSANPTLYTTTMNDVNVAPMVGIIANHNYDNCPPTATPAAINSFGKALWETEVAKLSCAGSFDGSMADGLYWARRIHLFMTSAQANAFHYWWLISGNPDNEGLTDQAGNPAKRMWVLGNFSRFVRPNFYRIGVTNNANTLISAYKDPVGLAFAIVAINTNATSVNQTFNLSNFPAPPPNVTPWITTSNYSLVNLSPAVVNNPSFTYPLPGMSVVTFVGHAANTPPTLEPVPDMTIDTVSGLDFYIVANDPDVAPQRLTFTILDGPTNAAFTDTFYSGGDVWCHFVWQPASSQADTTNLITVSVTDDGTPSFSATNSFTVVVDPLVNTPPALDPIPDQTVDAGVTLAVTNVATDPDVPPQVLTFTLLSGPVDSTLDTSSGVFTWRPTLSLANTTNLISVEVADDGTPSLSATNNFNVIVNPLALPILSAISLAGGQASFTVNGPPGQDYTLWTSTNLTDWAVLYTTNPPTTPVTLTDTNFPGDPERFYRIQLGQ